MNEELTIPSKPPDIILTEEQQAAVDKILKWADDPFEGNEFKLGGYAGTGKTTVIKFLLKELRKKYSVVVAAFTGKAVNVLSKKGVAAQTLHSLLYDAEVDPKTGQVEFLLKGKYQLMCQVIIVDEASMVSTDLYKDLKSFDKKYLFVGDPGQLEPVGDNPDLMRRPTLVLSKIHRQAEESPIIQLANSIRLGGPLSIQTIPNLTIRKKLMSSPEFLSADQVICARNKTRTMFNNGIRQFKKLPLNKIVEEEKLIVLRNNMSFGVFNGLLLFIQKIHKENPLYWECDCKDEVDRFYSKLHIWREPFEREIDPKELRVPKDVVYCDYGYCITCHKSQGSEWDKLIVWDEWMPPQVWDMKRWRYTAITRAAKELVYNV